MPLSAEQLDNWFRYHPPTDVTAPKYRAIREAEIRCAMDIDDAIADVGERSLRFDRVNTATRALAAVIDGHAPDSADKSAAIRCVRLARNAANEAIAIDCAGEHRDHEAIKALMQLVRVELLKARWQACTAIASGGK